MCFDLLSLFGKQTGAEMNKCDRNATSIQLYFFPCAAQLNSGGSFAASCTPERRTRRSRFGSTLYFQLVLLYHKWKWPLQRSEQITYTILMATCRHTFQINSSRFNLEMAIKITNRKVFLKCYAFSFALPFSGPLFSSFLVPLPSHTCVFFCCFKENVMHNICLWNG